MNSHFPKQVVIELPYLKTAITPILLIFYIKLQNRTKKEANWAAIIKVTILQETTYACT